MSKASLKKALKEISRDGLEEIICELYDTRPQAKEYLEFWINPDIEKEDEKYRLRIFRVFFITDLRPRKNPSLSDLKTHLAFFSSICFDPERIASLRIYSVGLYREWLEQRQRVSSHRNKVNKLMADTRAYIESHALEERFGLALDRLEEGFADIFKRGDRRSYGGWFGY